MLVPLQAALRHDVETPDGWRAAYEFEVPDSKDSYLIRLRAENTLSDGDGWSTTAEVDLRDLDPGRAFTEQDSDGVEYLTIPACYFRSVVCETHSRREEPWNLTSLRFPVEQGIDIKSFRKLFKSFLSEAEPRAYSLPFTREEVFLPFDEAIPLLRDVPFSDIPRFPAMYLQRSVEVDPSDFTLSIHIERPKLKQTSKSGISILTIDTAKLRLSKPVQASAYSFSLRDAEGASTAWARSGDKPPIKRDSIAVRANSQDEGERIIELFRTGIHRAREHKFWSEQGAAGQPATPP
ncbi:MAG: hypothetical protein KDE45_01995 [Caldilineaceae bacterium]|nr:hypothetical protein [Caldilineaceae bacterium]